MSTKTLVYTVTSYSYDSAGSLVVDLVERDNVLVDEEHADKLVAKGEIRMDLWRTVRYDYMRNDEVAKCAQ